MAYGESGIPHHEVPELGGAHERHMSGRREGSDMGCLTLECYANSGGGTSDVGGGVPGHLVSNQDPRLWAKEGRGLIGRLGRQAADPRKEEKRTSGVHTLGAKKNPVGVNLRGVVIGLGLSTVSGEGR